jgi:hypothetical protein
MHQHTVRDGLVPARSTRTIREKRVEANCLPSLNVIPGLLPVLAWQLNAEFSYDPNFSTEVEVSFTTLGSQRTRVDFEHCNLERFGAAAERLGKEMDEGWGKILQSFVRMAAAKIHDPFPGA